MIQMTNEELELWRSQIVISNPAAKMALRRPPYAFTEQGVAMLSSVLRTARAVEANIAIMRANPRLDITGGRPCNVVPSIRHTPH